LDRLIYRFNNKSSQSSFNSKNVLGGKGANLAQMAKLGLPVPPGFTISTKVCEYFYKNNKKIPKKIIQQIKKEINIIEKIAKKKIWKFVKSFISFRKIRLKGFNARYDGYNFKFGSK
jgi:pyruvate,orthophosphate dikinase